MDLWLDVAEIEEGDVVELTLKGKTSASIFLGKIDGFYKFYTPEGLVTLSYHSNNANQFSLGRNLRIEDEDED